MKNKTNKMSIIKQPLNIKITFTFEDLPPLCFMVYYQDNNHGWH